jgi:hypothetical protein
VSGALLLVATLSLEEWHWQQYYEAQALRSSSSGADAVLVDNPYQINDTSMSTYFLLFVACCAAATFWSVFVVIPCLLASRRVFSSTVPSHIVAAAIVCTVSGLAFAFTQHPNEFVSPMITFSAGGIVGLVSLALLARMLPPNTSLERTREG